MSDRDREQLIEEWVRDFFGLSLDELDREQIQKTVGQLHLTVTRWRTLPTVAFRKMNEEFAVSTGTYDQLEHECFEHGPSVLMYMGDGQYALCQHEVGGFYVVDPDAPDRFERFRKVWTLPDADQP